MAGVGRMSHGMPPCTRTKKGIHGNLCRPCPPISPPNACPTDISTGGWPVCTQRPSYNINSSPLASSRWPSHPPEALSSHATGNMTHYCFTGLSRLLLYWNKKTITLTFTLLWAWSYWMLNSQKTVTCLFSLFALKLCSTDFWLCLPPLHLEAYCHHV